MPEAKWSSFRAEDQSILAEGAEVLKEMKTSEKADTSPKQETDKVDVNAVKHKAATTEASAKSEEDNPIFQQLLKSCSTFPKIRRTLARYPHRSSSSTTSTRISIVIVSDSGPTPKLNHQRQHFLWYGTTCFVVRDLVRNTSSSIFRIHSSDLGYLEDVWG